MDTTVSLNAPSIHCNGCATKVKNRLGSLEEVSHVDASPDTKAVDVTFDSSKVTLETIQAEMADVGYPVVV